MTIQEIFDLAIKMGRKADPRPEEEIKKQLSTISKKYNQLPKKEKEYFPKERLTNPYPDSLIHLGNPSHKVKKILVTIDATEGKLLLAREIGVDLVLSHHPTGKSLAMLADAMKLQFYVYKKFGVPINIIEGMLRERIGEVRRSIHPLNHFLPVDTARLLKVNLMNVHTPADNLVFNFIEETIKKNKLDYVSDAIKMLFEIPEYQEAARRGAPPSIFAGNPGNHCGKVAALEMTGGTDGSNKIYPHLANAGIGTIISMHQSEAHRKEAQKSFINIVIASHIASDSLGMNLFIDELEKKRIEIMTAGGFIRVSRVNDKKGEIINSIK